MQYPGRTIRQGEADAGLVRAIRRRLQALHYDAGPPGGPFDAGLTARVKLFQSRNVDHVGRNLVADGKVGPLTWAALFAQPPQRIKAAPGRLAQAAIDIARTQVGVREQPRNSNAGPEVARYLQAVGLGTGHAWCAAFVYWCLREAAVATGETNTCLRHGGVLRQWQHAVEHRLARVSAADARNDPARVVPGMVFTMDHGAGLGHTGFVVAVRGGLLDTIEGNTDASRTREGGGVYALVRKVGEINKGYVLHG